MLRLAAESQIKGGVVHDPRTLAVAARPRIDEAVTASSPNSS